MKITALLFIASISIGSFLAMNLTPDSFKQEYSKWIDSFNTEVQLSIEDIKLSNSFAAKQSLWHSLEFELYQIKAELNDEISSFG